MKLSLAWLNRHVQLDLTPDKISEILTDIGLEVEGMTMVESVKGGLKGVKVAEVLTCEKHPNADRLSVTTVDYGEGPKQIVCGAPNVAAGQKVLVATPGTSLYDGEGNPFKIKSGKIRGEVSEGMICAEDELGLGESHDGIMVLDNETPVGKEASDYFNLSTDTVYDIGLTPNRSDGTNHLGSAKDLAAYIKVNIDPSITTQDHMSHSVAFTEDQPIKVVVEDYTLCPRFSGVLLENVQVQESPAFIKNYLQAIGIRPINNVVDITNFILHDIGQPLHAYDADKIKGDTIIVKTLPEGTVFTSLDEKDRNLLSTDLMVCDGESNPMCIGGVFGGLESGVTEGTTRIFLEAAHFNAKSIRVSSTKHNLRTDAAKVFEKGSDPNITTTAIRMAVHLLTEAAGAKVASAMTDLYPAPIERRSIDVSLANVNRLIGSKLTMDEVSTILRAMEMEVTVSGDDALLVKVPTNKADVLREVDVIEEILRIYGFNKVEIPSQLRSTIQFSDHPTKRYFKERLSNGLASRGLNEMMGLSLIESQKYEKIEGVSESDFVYINNTSNVHLDVMRPDMLISGLESVRRNLNYQQNSLALFEIGKTYTSGDPYQEHEWLSIFLSGPSSPESWLKGDQEYSFYDIKAVVLDLFDSLGVNKYQVSPLDHEEYWSYGIKIHQGPQVLAKLGAVTATILQNADVNQEVFFSRIDLDLLYQRSRKSQLTVSTISKFPAMRRDLAIVVDEHVQYEQIQKIVKKSAKQLLKDLDLFDVYRHDEHVGKGKKSYAVKIIFSDPSRTLKDKEIDKIMANIMDSLAKDLSASIR